MISYDKAQIILLKGGKNVHWVEIEAESHTYISGIWCCSVIDLEW